MAKMIFQALLCIGFLADTASAAVVLGPAGNTCPSGYYVVRSANECRGALLSLGENANAFEGSENDEDWPKGCYFCKNVPDCGDGFWFNRHPTGTANKGAKPVCTSAGEPMGEQRGAGVLFVGDSDVEYWESENSFPGSNNVGVGGFTCKQVLDRLDGYLSTHSPTRVVLVCGENDLDGVSVSTTLKRFNSIMDKLVAAGIPVLMMGTKPEPGTTSLHAKYTKYDEGVKARAKLLAAEAVAAGSQQVPLVFVDSFQAFLDLGNSNDLYDDDRLHMSDQGYSLWNQWAVHALAEETKKCVLYIGGTCNTAFSPKTLAPSSAPTAGPPACTMEEGVGNGIAFIDENKFVPLSQVPCSHAGVALAACIDCMYPIAVVNDGFEISIGPWPMRLTSNGAKFRWLPHQSCAVQGCRALTWSGMAPSPMCVSGAESSGKPCFCDDACTQYKDCCYDYSYECKAGAQINQTAYGIAPELKGVMW